MENGLREFMALIADEMVRQVDKHGIQADLPDIESIFITAEEFGEAVKDANDLHYRGEKRTEMEIELVQTAACLFRHWNRSRLRTDGRS